MEQAQTKNKENLEKLETYLKSKNTSLENILN
jgi:hypothetical protein